MSSHSEKDLEAETERVYTKAFPKHDAKTRDGDLLTKFCEVLSYQAAKTAVKFNMNQQNIKEAADLIILSKEISKLN